MREFSKPQEARQVEARARARTLGVTVAVVVEARRYVTASQSQPGTLYAIERTPAGWACSCQGYEYTGICKHLGQVERRSEREGWAFGVIASLAKVERYMPLDLPENVAVRGVVLTVATPTPDPDDDPEPPPAAGARRRRTLSDLDDAELRYAAIGADPREAA